MVSHSVITSPPDAEFDEEVGRYVDAEPVGQGIVLDREYPNRGAVLVDEAHNFRNINKRYVGLRSYLESGDHQGRAAQRDAAEPRPQGHLPPAKAVSWTRQSTGLNIEPVGLGGLFPLHAEIWHKYRAVHENYLQDYRERESDTVGMSLPTAPSPPSVPRADIEQVPHAGVHPSTQKGHNGAI